MKTISVYLASFLREFTLESAEFPGDIPEPLGRPPLAELIGIAVLLFLKEDGPTHPMAGDDDRASVTEDGPVHDRRMTGDVHELPDLKDPPLTYQVGKADDRTIPFFRVRLDVPFAVDGTVFLKAVLRNHKTACGVFFEDHCRREGIRGKQNQKKKELRHLRTPLLAPGA